MLDSVSTKECQWDPIEQNVGGLRPDNFWQPKGLISWNYLGTNLLTLICKLDHFVSISKTCCIAMKRSSLQKK